MEYRSGIGTPYWYEWMIGLTKCLDMLIDANIKSVILQSYDYQSLDDVVINYMDDTSVNVQVKHTDTYADENFTYGTLTSGETPMLKSWAIEWQKNKDKAQIKEIRIVTNKKWGPNKHSGRCSFKTFVEKVFPEIKKEYSYCGNDESEKNAIEWFKKTISFLGDDARYFVSTLSFEQSGDSQAIEEQLENQLKIIMGTGNTEAITLAKNALFAQLRIWATSRREEQEITKEGVYRVLCADSRIIPEYELYPQKPIFPSRIKFAKSFCKILKESDKRVILLEGLPGAGKTNFVSCLSQLDDIPIDFRFYTYIPVNKRYPSYSDDEGYYSGEIFWHSLLTQLKKGFEKAGKLSDIQFPIIYSYMSVREMRETALKYLPIYADLLGRTCYLFVDGLDHASRSVNVRNSFLYQLPEPEEISGNVKIILVSQPINEHFPLWFSNNSEIEYISLPVLEESDVEILLQIERINIPDIDIQSLSHSIIKVAGNNALNILFAIQELHTADSTWDFDSIIKRLEERNLNAQISKYYEWIINALQNEPLLPKIELIFAFASRKIPLNHISFMCGVSNDDIAIALDKLFPLIMHENEEYYVFHNDVRLYLKRAIISSRGYLAIALNVRDRIISEEALGCYAYDIIFGSLFEVKSDNYILDIFTSKYITDSLKYDIPLNKLVSQFAMVAQKIGEHKNLDALNNLSQVATTINQYIYCVQYYEKENDYYENKYVKSKTKSEKYILDSRKDSKQIIGDIYFLLINGQLDRGKELFIEYLCSFELLDFLSLAFEDTPSDIVGIHEQSGFVCRYFNDHILAQECDTSSKAYLMFVSGWLKASSAFISNSDLNQTFSFKSYYSDALVSYIETICKKDEISSEIFNLLDYHLLSADTAPILALIELCIKEIFNHHDASQLINVIIQRYHEIEMPGILDGMKFTSEKIPIFIKMVFCIYPYLTDVSHLHDIYEKLLRENRISASDRGYKPARKQFSCALTVFENYYRQKNNTNELIDVIYSLEYLSNKYGIGSCHDCESFRVRHFLLSVICKSYDLENNLKKTSEFCSVLTNIFVCEEPRYISELIPLFVVAGEKSLFLEIAEFWAGANGLMWKNEFNDVEFYFNSFSNALNDFNLLELKNKIELRKKYRIISYTGHKDYALKTLLDWYTHLPLNTKKLAIYGMQLLSISDYANKIGDNRMQHEITKEIFRTAVDLGVQFADALFELKNNPKDYYYWRECLLDTYLEKVSESYFCNEDLFSLYQIVNAWIKVEIEETVQRGYNKTKHLQYYNSTIYSLIDCQKYKDLIKSNGNYIYVPSESSANITSKGDYAWLLELIKEQGYNDEIKSRIRSTYSDSYYGKVEFLISVGSTLEQSSIPIFVRDCVVDYILMESTYGMVDMGLDRLIDKYYKYFSDNDWQNFLINAISKVSLNGERVFYYTSNDLEILSLYYSLTKSMEEYEKAFIERLKLHWSFITAGALLNYSVYSLTPDPNISSIKDFKLKHIGQ